MVRQPGTALVSPINNNVLPVNEGALSRRVVTHYHHNDLLSGRQEPDSQAAGDFHQA